MTLNFLTPTSSVLNSQVRVALLLISIRYGTRGPNVGIIMSGLCKPREHCPPQSLPVSFPLGARPVVVATYTANIRFLFSVPIGFAGVHVKSRE